MNKLDRAIFQDACVQRLTLHLHCSLEAPHRRLDTCFSSPDHSTLVVVRIAKHDNRDRFMFSIDDNHMGFLEDQRAEKCFIALGCDSADILLLIPFSELSQLLPRLNRRPVRKSWYLEIHQEANGRLVLHGKEGMRLDLTRYQLNLSSSAQALAQPKT